MKPSPCSTRVLFYSFWIGLSVIQAFFTELLHDEAYYWMYSKNLAWGYFDHPPVIAVVVKLGYFFIQNELGVRLFIILLNAATIFLIEEIVKPKNQLLFYAIIASILLMHYGSILAIPDIPLLFFAASFFYLYKRYTQKPSWLFIILLGVNSGLLILSKYHGILVIGFTLLSNLQLLKKASIWIAMLIALLIFSPHLLWQFEHHFPTITYQLVNRSETGFNIAHLLEYVFTQPLIYGPIIGFGLLFFGFKARPENDFERALKFTLVGVFGLFLLLSLRGKIEAHWTDVSFVPLIYFGYQGISGSLKWKRFTYTSLPISLFLFFLLRVFLIWNFTPENWKVETELHDWDIWAEQIKEVAEGSTVVHTNSYQNAAKYGFYSGNQSISMNDATANRLNQFDIWRSEANLQGESVMVISHFFGEEMDSLETLKRTLFYSFRDQFRTYPEITIETTGGVVNCNKADSVELEIKLKNAIGVTDRYDSLPKSGVQLYALFYKKKFKASNFKTGLLITEELLTKNPVQKVFVAAPDTGTFSMRFAISNDTLPFRFHSNKTIFKVK